MKEGQVYYASKKVGQIYPKHLALLCPLVRDEKEKMLMAHCLLQPNKRV